MTSVRGLSALVSGATGGLGTPISRRPALEGAQLTLLGRDIRRLEALDLNASLVTGDLREPETAVRAAAAAVAEHGRLDGLGRRLRCRRVRSAGRPARRGAR